MFCITTLVMTLFQRNPAEPPFSAYLGFRTRKYCCAQVLLVSAHK